MSGKTLRVLWISLAVVAIFSVTAALVVSGKIRAYLRSNDFRDLVSQQTGAAFRADARYAPLRWTGASVFSDSLVATGRPGSIIQSVRAEQIRAEVNWRAAFSGAWRVDRIEALTFDGTFRPGADAVEDAAPASGPAGWFDAWLPQRFEFGVLDVAKARIQFLGPDEKPIVSVTDSAMALRPDGAGWTINGKGGELVLPKVPVLAITAFRSRIQNGVFFLTDANFRLGEAGKVSASGEFAEASKVHVVWSGVDVARFLDEAWRNRLTGVVAGTADVEWPSTGPAAGTATGTFKLTDGLVEHVATLDQVAAFTGAPQFRRMPLQELSGNYLWQGGNLTLSNVVLESVGLLRVEGQCTISANGAVDGTFQVGVAPQTLQWLPGSRERVFTESRQGYVWTPVRVGGTTAKVTEDLSGRLAHAMRDQVIQTGVHTIEKLPEAARDGAGTLLNILTPLVR